MAAPARCTCRRAPSCRRGAPVDVIFRPEDATTHLDPVDGAIECAVERIVFQGGMSECQLRLGSCCCGPWFIP